MREIGSKTSNQDTARQFLLTVLFTKEALLKTCLMDKASMSGLTGMFTREDGRIQIWKEKDLSGMQMVESMQVLSEEITF